MLGEQEMLMPLVLAETREGLEALGYRVAKCMIAADTIHVTLANGRTASVDIPFIVNVGELSADLATELDDRLRKSA